MSGGEKDGGVREGPIEGGVKLGAATEGEVKDGPGSGGMAVGAGGTSGGAGEAGRGASDTGAGGVCRRRVKSPGPAELDGEGGGGAVSDPEKTEDGSTERNMRVNSPACSDWGGATGWEIGLTGAGVDWASGD